MGEKEYPEKLAGNNGTTLCTVPAHPTHTQRLLKRARKIGLFSDSTFKNDQECGKKTFQDLFQEKKVLL